MKFQILECSVHTNKQGISKNLITGLAKFTEYGRLVTSTFTIEVNHTVFSHAQGKVGKIVDYPLVFPLPEFNVTVEVGFLEPTPSA